MLSSLKSLASSSAIKSAYTINDDSGFRAGAWLVQDAVKKSTKQEVSVLTFTKKTLEQPLQRTFSSLRQGFDTVYAQLKGEAATLARLRHPAMLEVVESIEESRSSIMFVTERVTGCLSSMVADDDEDSYSNRRIRGDSNKLDEIEIQKGLLQITIGLEFLQGVAKIVHGNLVPSSIFINQKGDWKLGGFSFSVPIKDSPHFVPPDYDNRLPQSVQRHLDYAAPEFVIDETVDPLNDMFSLGCLICALVSTKHKSIIQCNQNMHLYRKAVETLNVNSVPGIPPYLRDVLPQLLTRRPANRLSAHAFQSSPFFDNILMNSIRFLDSFPEKTTSERQSFMKGLQAVIPQFPPRVLTKKILPGLLDQFQDHTLLPLILPNIFIIAESMTQKVFSEAVLPKLKTVFKVTDSPGASMFMLEKVPVMKTKVTGLELKEDVMTLVYTALSGDIQYLQEKALQVSAELVRDLDLITVKTALFPKIAEVFTHTTMLGIKVTALETFNQLVLHSLDKYTITEKLLPLVKGIKTKEPAVGMAALALSKSCGDKVDHEIIAMDILPQLWSMSLGPLLSQSQFRSFMSTIKELSTKVEVEQSKKLSDSGAPLGTKDKTNVTSDDLMESGPTEDISFESLVLGSKPKPTISHNNSTTSFNNFTLANGKGRTPSPNPSASFNWSTPAPPDPHSSTPAATPTLSQQQFKPQNALHNYPIITPSITGPPSTSSRPPQPVSSYSSTHPYTNPPPPAHASLQAPVSGITARSQSAAPNYNVNATGIDWSSATLKPTFPTSNANANAGIPGPFGSGGSFGAGSAIGQQQAGQSGWNLPMPKPAGLAIHQQQPHQQQQQLAPGQQNGTRKGLDSYQSLL